MYNFLDILSNFGANMRNKRLKILVTNDDGFDSKGFKTLVNLCSLYGDTIGIAPKTAQSGKSAAISMKDSLWLDKISTSKNKKGNKIEIFSFTGTPVDCVKMAMNYIFSNDNKPDLLFSGVNHGSNASAAAIYSGTLGAAQEGTIYGIKSIALSIDSHDTNVDLKNVEEYFPILMDNILSFPQKDGIYLNINFPDIPTNKIKGIKFAEQGAGLWVDELDMFENKHKQTFYMMSGRFLDKDSDGFGDHKVVKNGYISIVPHMINTTDYQEIKRLSNLWSNTLKKTKKR